MVSNARVFYRFHCGKMREFMFNGFSPSIMYRAKLSAKNESRNGGNFDKRGEGMERSWGKSGKTSLKVPQSSQAVRIKGVRGRNQPSLFSLSTVGGRT